MSSNAATTSLFDELRSGADEAQSVREGGITVGSPLGPPTGWLYDQRVSPHRIRAMVKDYENLNEALLDAERRALAYQEFIAHTLDEYGERMSSQWKAHARSVLSDDA